MKAKVVLLGAMMTASISSFAKTGVETGTKYGTGQDSLECIQNISLFSQYAKQGDYKSAGEFWEKVYKNCPQSSKNIYIHGPKIIGAQIEAEADANKKAVLFDKLMKVYDDRVKYFGNDRKMNKNMILAEKAASYIKYVPTVRDPQKTKAYGWLAEVIENEGSNAKATVFQNYFMLSDSYYKADKQKNAQQYLDDYLKISPLLSECLANATGKDSANYATVKSAVDASFAASGVADCKTLDGVYGPQVNSKKSDMAFLNMVLKLYSIADCEESDVYFKASEYKHAIEPSAGSARGLASKAAKDKNYAKALGYYQEAVKLETDNNDKSNLQLKIASIYRIQKNYAASRSAAQAALNYKASNSSAYILIATLYAETANSISDDATIRQSAYWAAVDKLEKAKQVDPSCAANVNKMINAYKDAYPGSSELFMRGLTDGKEFTVPGWINEKTTVRGRK